MKKLLLTSVFVLVLASPLSAFAGNNIFGISTPVEKSQVNSNVLRGYVARDLSDTFNIQKLHKQDTTVRDLDSNEKYYVFGVNLNDLNRI